MGPHCEGYLRKVLNNLTKDRQLRKEPILFKVQAKHKGYQLNDKNFLEKRVQTSKNYIHF